MRNDPIGTTVIDGVHVSVWPTCIEVYTSIGDQLVTRRYVEFDGDLEELVEDFIAWAHNNSEE